MALYAVFQTKVCSCAVTFFFLQMTFFQHICKLAAKSISYFQKFTMYFFTCFIGLCFIQYVSQIDMFSILYSETVLLL